jgi:lipopolysaccharide/colanic/teichoic acid biosynthesis glycosyltransferase
MSSLTEAWPELAWVLSPPVAGTHEHTRSGELRAGRLRLLRRDLFLGALAACAVLAGAGLLTDRPAFSAGAGLVMLLDVGRLPALGSRRTLLARRPVATRVAVATGATGTAVALTRADVPFDALLLGAVAAIAALGALRLVVRSPRVAGRYGLGRPSRLVVGDPGTLVAGRAAAGRTSSVTSMARVVEVAAEADVDELCVVPGRGLGPEQIRELSWLTERSGVELFVAAPVEGVAPHRVRVSRSDGRLLLRVGSARPRGGLAVARTTLDRLLAAALLVVALPGLCLVAVLVRLDSHGPALYRQTRVGQDGRTFTMYKFRTMRRDAERQLRDLAAHNVHGPDSCVFKLHDDPRVTRLGRLLRRSSVDELPQLVNVVRGEMSLIGPRPALPSEVARYDEVARRRLAARPGMTGLWQVSGRSRLSWSETIACDLEYVDNWSPRLDLSIAARTVGAVFRSDGAY